LKKNIKSGDCANWIKSMAMDLAAVGGSVLIFQALYWLAHVVSKTFVLKYGAMTVYDRNQVCQFVCSFVKVWITYCHSLVLGWVSSHSPTSADTFWRVRVCVQCRGVQYVVYATPSPGAMAR